MRPDQDMNSVRSTKHSGLFSNAVFMRRLWAYCEKSEGEKERHEFEFLAKWAHFARVWKIGVKFVLWVFRGSERSEVSVGLWVLICEISCWLFFSDLEEQKLFWSLWKVKRFLPVLECQKIELFCSCFRYQKSHFFDLYLDC